MGDEAWRGSLGEIERVGDRNVQMHVYKYKIFKNEKASFCQSQNILKTETKTN